eukprot:10588181-Lingulodinium_polyedra.AAC.1
MAIRWPDDGQSMATRWPLDGHSMATRWPFNGHSMVPPARRFLGSVSTFGLRLCLPNACFYARVES